MGKIKATDGIEKEISCIGCAIQKGKIKRFGGVVAETRHFEVTQDYEIPIPGFMILASKKHIKGIEEFSKEMRAEFVELLFRVRKAMKSALGIDYVCLIQEENSILASSHFHLWIFPRYKWMEKLGLGIRSVKPIMEYARKKMRTKSNLAKVKIASSKLTDFLA